MQQKFYMEFEIAAVRLKTQSGFHVWLVVCWENMTRLKPCPKILLKHFCSLHCQNKCIRFSFSSWKKGVFSVLSNSYFLWIAICRYQSLEKSKLKSISLEFLSGRCLIHFPPINVYIGRGTDNFVSLLLTWYWSLAFIRYKFMVYNSWRLLAF